MLYILKVLPSYKFPHFKFYLGPLNSLGGSAGADPGAGKGRGTNRLSRKWLGDPDSLVSFEAANNHLLEVSHC